MDDVSSKKPRGTAQSEKRDGLLTKKQVADLLGCHPRTVRRMELKGELPGAVTKGRLKRWRKQSVLEWLDDTPRSSRRRAR
jgi:excisionase family DNA binding protein